MNELLVVTPNGYKASKLYSIVPADGSGDLTWVRNTTATRVNSSGLIESVSANVPRLDYSGGVTCPCILVEPQRTNYILRSSEMNNASWIGIRAGTGILPAVTPDNVVSPDGTTNADTIVLDRGAGNTVSDYSWFYQFITTFNGVYTVSFWIKASTISDVGKTLRIRIMPANINTNITVPLDWTRITLTSTSSGLGTATALDIFNRGTLTTGNSVSFALWGVQVEIGSTVSSYIPTTSASVTRNADVGTVTTPIGITSLIETYEDNTTNVVNPIPVTYQMSEGRIAKVVGL